MIAEETITTESSDKINIDASEKINKIIKEKSKFDDPANVDSYGQHGIYVGIPEKKQGRAFFKVKTDNKKIKPHTGEIE